MAFTEAKRKPLTEEANGTGAGLRQEGQKYRHTPKEKLFLWIADTVLDLNALVSSHGQGAKTAEDFERFQGMEPGHTALDCAKAVLSYLKDTRGVLTWTRRDLEDCVRMKAREAEAILALLRIQGYVQPRNAAYMDHDGRRRNGFGIEGAAVETRESGPGARRVVAATLRAE